MKVHLRVGVNERMTEIQYDSEEYWKETKIYIYDPQVEVSEEESMIIIEYLYNEGFIQDRRIPYELVRIEY